MTSLQRFVAQQAAALLVASMVVGALAAFAMTAAITANAKMLLAAHVTGVIATVLLIAFAWTLPMLSFGDTGRTRLAWIFLVSSWANVIVGTGKAFFDVHGVGLTGDTANDVVYGLLNVFVVLPTFAASIGWFLGLRVKATS